MDNVTVESLEKRFPGEGRKRFEEIRDRGGYGDVPLDYKGGLDVRGIVDPQNQSFTDKQKSEFAELAGMDKSDRERIDAGTVSTVAASIGKKKS